MPKKKNPTTTTNLDDKDGLALIRLRDNPFLYISGDTRDSIVAANTFLLTLVNTTQDPNVKIGIRKVINHLSDMLYGFDEREPKT